MEGSALNGLIHRVYRPLPFHFTVSTLLKLPFGFPGGKPLTSIRYRKGISFDHIDGAPFPNLVYRCGGPLLGSVLLDYLNRIAKSSSSPS